MFQPQDEWGSTFASGGNSVSQIMKLSLVCDDKRHYCPEKYFSPSPSLSITVSHLAPHLFYCLAYAFIYFVDFKVS